MLLLHLSREKIILQGKGFSKELPYLDIERQFPLLLIDTVAAHAITKVWVINGPGSFTTLRLGCLTLNTLKQFGKSDLEIVSCSKLDVYRRAVEQGFLPALGLMWIGQKKNMWSCTTQGDDVQGSEMHAGWQCSIINQEHIAELAGQEYFIDACEHILLDSLDQERMVEWKFDGEAIMLTYHQKTLSIASNVLGLSPIEQLVPHYMIEPQIG